MCFVAVVVDFNYSCECVNYTVTQLPTQFMLLAFLVFALMLLLRKAQTGYISRPLLACSGGMKNGHRQIR